ncbi:hypothetical protein BV394_05870 [Brevirhabdus pacifica]|uniref:Uncharacterized protein n=1 Tax=Brevirhabdus pacifica TaxID=1267768 RepID=A0A1U7DHD6_9RHOB|nr:serine protease [Brevirhabdus pacifica]APX89303.1 hypothetical protein BV394_05870 [Brevirhabdus pacifica]OWU76664.1 hypothetical protein ATO5_10415 [Loktanella sp. 22II-4b]PJJ86080.1 putative peptidoglycan binding protein [Brevirhabdus pacifica]
MTRWIAAYFFVMMAWTGAALAQTGSWIQIEARPTLRQAEDRARAFSSRLQDVTGHALSTGWYAIALGPYTAAEARVRLRTLRNQGAVPRDAFIADGGNFRQQFWPAGRDATTTAEASTGASTEGQVVIEPAIPEATETPGVTPEATTEAAPGTATAEVTPEATPDPEPVEETPAQARASERLLTEAERKDLQRALEWEGHYSAAIDGDFGAGTRAAMSSYQQAQGDEVTGILTIRQRTRLMDGYTSVLAELDLATVVDERAGVEVMMPTALVKFDRVEPPFVHYSAATDRDVRVLLISQPGTRQTLYGLFDIMQTLAIVPIEGERSKSGDSFVLTGQGTNLHSYTWARHDNGQIKGFALVFPPEDARVMNRVASMMRDSFASTGETVLAPAAAADAPSQIDLVSGLEVRRPTVSRSGFYVDGKGTVVTTADAVAQCSRVTIDDSFEADVTRRDETSGLAVLKPRQSLAPLAHATFTAGTPVVDSQVAVSGFSYEGALGAPTLTYGQLSELRGLAGEENIQRLEVAARSGDAGGPVFDRSGTVLGMLLARGEAERQLPEDVHFAVKPAALGKVLTDLGITTSSDSTNGVMAPEDLALLASDMTVLVSCWE